MELKRFPLALLILLTCIHCSFAQEAKQFSFRHFTVTNGLASNTIHSIAQDQQGYIWLATLNGLQRYDGNGFITFRPHKNDPQSLPSTYSFHLHVDRSNQLWITNFENRVGIFDAKKFVFREAKIENGKEPLFNLWLFELPGRELMLRSNNKVYRYQAKEHKFVPSPETFVLPPRWKFETTLWDEKRKKFWIASDSGLVLFDPATRLISYRGHNVHGDPIINAFSKRLNPLMLSFDDVGNPQFFIWPPRSGNGFVYRYDPVTKKELEFNIGVTIGYHEVAGFLHQKSGRYWAYGLPFMMQWNPKSEQPYLHLTGVNPEASSIKFDHCYQVLEDREQNLWMATDNGVYLFNPDAQIFNTFNLQRKGKPTAERVVQALAEIPDGRIFIGCWGAGVYVYDQQFNPLPMPKAFEGKEFMSVWDMAWNKKTGELWMTLQAGGIAVYNPKTEKLTEVYPEIFGGSTIRQVDDDTSGNLWFGTHNGKVISWDLKKSGNDPTKGYELVVKTGLVRKVHYEYNGYFWIGTEAFGLLKIDAKTKKIVKEFRKDGPAGERLFSDVVMDMTYYNDSISLVIANCIHVLNKKTNQITLLSAEDGLPSNTAISVEKDANGIIWVGMVNGICRVNLAKKLISYYDRRNGMAYDKFSPTGVNELNDGRLVFYTDHNFLVFDPKQFGQNTKPKPPLITGFRLGDQWLSLDSIQQAGGVVHLDYNNTSIGVNFSALSYLLQTRQHYYYKMEGLDKDWIRSDKPLEAIYNYLPNGTYTFKVRSENTDGISGEEMASLQIVVRPPFWKSWWFWGLMILLGGTIVYALDRERQNRKKIVRRMRSEIAGNLHTEVNHTLNNINVLSEIAKIKADKNIEQSKEFIDQISAKSRYMIEAMDDMLWSIDPQNDSMKKTLFRIKEFTDSLRAENEVDIDLIVDNKVQSLELDMKLRHELFFFYKEGMQFLIKNTSCTQVFVNINQVRSKLMLEILTEFHHLNEELVQRFKRALQKRAQLLHAQMEVTFDSRSFSVILYVSL
jgi:ligand-binding sensor domain-containing protein